jgi:hypothetical protein
MQVNAIFERKAYIEIQARLLENPASETENRRFS